MGILKKDKLNEMGSCQRFGSDHKIKVDNIISMTICKCIRWKKTYQKSRKQLKKVALGQLPRSSNSTLGLPPSSTEHVAENSCFV